MCWLYDTCHSQQSEEGSRASVASLYRLSACDHLLAQRKGRHNEEGGVIFSVSLFKGWLLFPSSQFCSPNLLLASVRYLVIFHLLIHRLCLHPYMLLFFCPLHHSIYLLGYTCRRFDTLFRRQGQKFQPFSCFLFHDLTLSIEPPKDSILYRSICFLYFKCTLKGKLSSTLVTVCQRKSPLLTRCFP